MKNKKEELRKIAKTKRESLDIDNISERIVKHIRCLSYYKSAKKIMLYHPLKTEFNLLKLLNDEKEFAFPIIKNDEIYPVFWDAKKRFKEGTYKIMEPEGEIFDNYNCLDIIIIPALACDLNGYRLGYGKGYYDRFLKRTHCKAKKIVITSDTLLMKKIPIEEHDEKADIVITESRILYTDTTLNY